jgi:hypothetical protein
MKGRQKCPVAGPTTGCCPIQAACIKEKQRGRHPAVRYTHKKKKTKNKYIHIPHTSMHVVIYDCMGSESEQELGNQLSRILTKANKQTCMCLCMYMCMRSEGESASHSSPPQLNGVRVPAGVCARVWAGTISLISLLCLFVCRCTRWDTKTHIHTQATLETQANTRQVMMENQHLFTVSQSSATRNTHTHQSDERPAKMSGGRADNWLLFK